jgi:predicted dehydrogenase
MQRRTEKKCSPARSRRDFIKTSSLLVAGGAVAGGLNAAHASTAFASDEVRIGLIGCGGRGAGAVVQALNTADHDEIKPNGPVRLVAMADVFADRLQGAYRSVMSKHRDRVDVPKDRRFTGLDAYEKLLECDVDLVILATPPGWRPLHFEAAVRAGKHVFLEKPVATDASGIRRILAANEDAKRQGLTVAVGLQRRHEPKYIETIRRLQDGAIGDIVCIRVYWNGGGGACVRPRQKGQSELEYQLRNWYYFNWLSGDHIVEQHVHNLDVGNWLMQSHPVQCNGMGGRQVRTGAEHGEIYDHHFCEFTYASGARMFSQCRHIQSCWNSVGEHVHGTKGSADISGAKIYGPGGHLVWKSDQAGGGHQLEHDNLFAALRRGESCNEVDSAAESTFTAILGRMASYSGKCLKWDDAIRSGIALADVDQLRSLHDEAPVMPREGGSDTAQERYQIAIPGKTQVI